MRIVERELDRILALLRKSIRERGFTQVEVQEKLGWGKSYISQLVTGQKSLRVEHVLMILNVIDVKPEDFFAEIYQFGAAFGPASPARRAAPPKPEEIDAADHGADLHRLRLLHEALVSVLTRKRLIKTADLERAIERAKREDVAMAGHGILPGAEVAR